MVSEEKSSETDDGRFMYDGACLYYKLPWSLQLRGAETIVGLGIDMPLLYYAQYAIMQILLGGNPS